MIDREAVLAVLRKRFPDAGAISLAEAANAIVGLEDAYEEITLDPEELGYHASVQCLDICALAERIQPDDEVRIFRKRTAKV
jgi:hypothetical protein